MQAINDRKRKNKEQIFKQSQEKPEPDFSFDAPRRRISQSLELDQNPRISELREMEESEESFKPESPSQENFPEMVL